MRLHERALKLAKMDRETDRELVEVLIAIDKGRLFIDEGYPNLFKYVEVALGYSRAATYGFISVVKACAKFKELRTALSDLSVAKIQKFVSVVTEENVSEWIVFAQTHTFEEIEARRAHGEEKVRKTGFKLTPALKAKFKRVQELEMQRRQAPVTPEEALEKLLDFYLEKNDPIRKAARAEKREAPAREEEAVHVRRQNARPPAASRHAVNLRDQGQCTLVHPNGARCSEKKWIDIHHIVRRADGGGDEPANLRTLCGACHDFIHQLELPM